MTEVVEETFALVDSRVVEGLTKEEVETLEQRISHCTCSDADPYFKKSLSDEKFTASHRRSSIRLFYHIFKLPVFLFANTGAYRHKAAHDVRKYSAGRFRAWSDHKVVWRKTG